MNMLVRGVQSLLRRAGVEVVRYRPDGGVLDEYGEDVRNLVTPSRGLTMTSIERQVALVAACRYVVDRRIPGCFVECGVWRGGSSAIAARTFAERGDTSRELFLFDTYEGMTAPTTHDRSSDGTLAQAHLDRDPNREGVWCVAGIDEVRRTMAATGYPGQHVHYVVGPVEATVPSQAPEGPIAILRLDTDWYESTAHELTHFFPRLSEGGVLIVDDYGHWSGARKAVDEFLQSQQRAYYLHRIDNTGRALIKC